MLALYVGVGLAAYFLTPSTSIATFVIAMVAVLATMFVLRVDGQSQMRRLQQNDPHALETHFVELDPDGIRTWCAHVEARYPWSEFTTTTENNEFYLFVRPSGTGAAIPKRLLDDGRDAVLRAHIREWAPDRGAGLACEAT